MKTQIGTFRIKSLVALIAQQVSIVLGLLVFLGAALPTTAQTNPPCVPAPAGLVGWWSAEGNAQDQTGLNNGDALACSSFGQGVKGQAFEFFGGNQLVRIPNSPSLNPTNAMTLEGWVYISDFPTTIPMMVVAAKYDVQGSRQFLIDARRGQTNWIFESRLQLTTAERTLSASTPIQQRTWYHVAMTYGNGTAALYVNGQLEASVAGTGTIPWSPNPLLIGARASGPYGLYGRVDELSLYNRGLSAAEILSIFQSGSNGKCPVDGPTLQAPIITVQPASQTVAGGNRAMFEVTATGSAPLSYQWYRGGVAVKGATDRVLFVNTVPSYQVIPYSVIVTNGLGAIRSSNAVLTVTYPSSTPAPSGIVAWWKASGNTMDSVGTNRAQGSVRYGAGKVGSSFLFTGTNTLTVPASPSLEVQSFTIEGWIKTSEISTTPRPIAEYAAETGHGTIHFWHNINPGIQPAPGALYALIRSTNGTYLEVNTAANALPSNEWAHVAFTMDYGSGIGRLYVDGKNLGSATNQNLGPVNTALPFNIGHRPEGSAELLAGTRFIGQIDELSVYRRALNSAEILSIYNSSLAGKGPPGVAPSIVAQPVGQEVSAGNDAVFQVSATGTAPMFYQWYRDNNIIPGAIGQTLVIGNAQTNPAGFYSVIVSNAYGLAQSSNVSLSIVPAQAIAVPSGAVAWWKAENNTQDSIGTNDAFGSADYTPGKVGQGFVLGSTNRLTVPASPDLVVESFTIEGWIKTPDVSSTPRPIAEYAAETGNGTIHFWHNIRPGIAAGPGALYGLVRGTNGTYLEVSTPSNVLPSNSWTHVAYTMDYSAKVARLYVNGRNLGSATNLDLAPADSTLPLNIGHRPIGSAELLAGRQFIGQMDELTLYRRALTPDEIAGICGAASLGKAEVPVGGLPVITSQPADQTVNVGGQAAFEVTVVSSNSLSYQWYRNDASVAGGTDRVLVLTNVQPGQAGSYSVWVSNMFGAVVSSNAILNVVTQQQQCIAAPSGLVGWWKAEANTDDSALSNDATVVGSAQYGDGKVGDGFLFGGSNAYSVAASPSMAVTSFTIESWVKPSATTPQPIAEYCNENGYGSIHLWHNIHPYGANIVGALYAVVRGNDGSYIEIYTPANAVPAGEWSHVAFTMDYSSKIARLLVGGQVLAEGTNQNLAVPESAVQFNIGRRPEGSSDLLNGTRFRGSIDELSVYNRALTPAEVDGIYQAGSAGKCSGPVGEPPVITSQPANQTVNVGGQAVFEVTAVSSNSLSYQWYWNDASVAGGTDRVLVLTNVQPGQAGTYSVWVSNMFGAVVSSNATLTVVTQQQQCIAAPSGLVGWWKAEGNTEDSALNNDATVVGYPQYGLGKVGNGFVFGGSNAYSVAASPSMAVTSFTIESWIRSSATAPQPIAEYANETGYGSIHLWHNIQPGGVGAPGALYGIVRGNDGSYLELGTAGNVVPGGEWAHVAFSMDYHTKVGRLYVNGQNVALVTNVNLAAPDSAMQFNIGRRPEGSADLLGGYRFSGFIDELSVYNRALTPAEVAGIYEASSGGKCPVNADQPPIITAQPTNQTVDAGAQATFEVTATSFAPVSYQWYFNNSMVLGASSRALVLTNVQPEQAGAYSVLVSNMFGGVLSSNATLTVVTQQCAGVPLGLIGWWKAEGNTLDSALSNHAFVVGFPQFGPGKVGSGFLFGGTNAYSVPSSPSMQVSSFTIESWIKTSETAPQPIAEYGNETGYGTIHLWHNIQPGGIGAPGALYGLIRGTNGSYLEISTAPGVVPSNAWAHVAFTMDYGAKLARLFVNGRPVAFGTNRDLAMPDTAMQFNIGRRPEGSYDLLNGYCFLGSIDEMSLYNRALTSDEISSLYQSTNGKCSIIRPMVPVDPGVILLPPGIFPSLPSRPGIPAFPVPWANLSGVTVVVRGVPGEIYRVQSAASVAGPWQDAGTATMDALGRGVFEDANANAQKGFYRLVK